MTRFFTVGKYRQHNRKDHRYDLPRLTLTVSNLEFQTYDWSLGGFRIKDYNGRPPVGDTAIVSALSYFEGKAIAVNCKATVTRIVLGKDQVAFSFNELDEIAFEFLEEASIHRLALLSASDK
ncbi:MAG: PilZ domain-containing protein [Sneathiella sp.]|nr:PilZ domain-containing protein [Sneathiella sp.]